MFLRVLGRCFGARDLFSVVEVDGPEIGGDLVHLHCIRVTLWGHYVSWIVLEKSDSERQIERKDIAFVKPSISPSVFQYLIEIVDVIELPEVAFTCWR